MPYIRADRRKELENTSKVSPVNSGELNYCITRILIQYWNHGIKSYQSINDIIGAVEAAKYEFYRRVVAPYEDRKILENGDVYLDA